MSTRNELLEAILTATGGIPPTAGVKEIYSEADFPAPSSGTIQLEDNTTYIVNGAVTMVNVLLMGSNSPLIGNISITSQLIYVGAGTFLSAVSNRIYVRDLGVITVNPASTLISKTGAEFCTFRQYFIQCAGAFGSIQSDNDVFFNQGLMNLSGNGIAIAAGETVDYLEISESRVIQNSTSPCLDITGALLNSAVLRDSQYIPASGVVLKGDASSVNVNTSFDARDNNFLVAFGQQYLDGVSEADIKYNFDSNSGIGVKDSIFLGTAILENNATVTTAGSPATIAGTFQSGDFDQRTLVQVTGGRIDNLSGTIITPRIVASGTIDNDAGGQQSFVFQFYLNGVVVPKLRAEVTVDGNDMNSWTFGGDIEIPVSGFVEVKVMSAADFIVPDMQFIVRG